ncbi:MAG: hypothetical protein AB7R89_33525 [Dehalococcoidia bacterium]
MPRWLGPRKYDPLAAYLAQVTDDQVTLTLAEIEAILGTPLPATATSSDFWRNYARAWPAHAWRDVGWRVARHPSRQAVTAVTFVREPPAMTTSFSAPR